MTSSRLLGEARWKVLTLLGLRVLFLVGMSFALELIQGRAFLGNLTTSGPVGSSTTTTAFVWVTSISAGMILLLTASVWIPRADGLRPYGVIALDWLLAGGFIYLSEAHPGMTLVSVGLLLTSALPLLEPMAASVYALVTAALAVGIIVYQSDVTQPNTSIDMQALLEAEGIDLLLVMLLALGIVVWSLAQWRFGERELRTTRATAKQRAERIDRMRDRLHAVAELSNTFTGTLDFERIVESTLAIGDISLRESEDTNQRILSLVLLFRSDGYLYVADSRGLKTGYENRKINPDGGLIAHALDEGYPVITDGIRKDPVLSGIAGFKQMKSLLFVPLRAHYDNFGLLIFGTTASKAFDPDHIDMLNAIGVQTTVALQNAVLYNNLLREKERIIQMEEDARKSLVRDLHDIPTQTVSSMAMRLRIAMRYLEKGRLEELMNELKEIEGMSLRATEEIRHVLFKLRPLALESQGLVAALNQLAEKMQSTYDQKVVIKVGSDVENILNDTQQGALFYLIEEGVNNARKYAEAETIQVQAGRRNDTLIVRVADNGKGFDTEAVDEGYDGRGSFGMVNMRERAEILEGTLSVSSAPGKGTTVEVVIPIDTQPEEERRRLNGRLSATKFAGSARRNLSDLAERP